MADSYGVFFEFLILSLIKYQDESIDAVPCKLDFFACIIITPDRDNVPR